eukprot:9920752-Alexandrium_andersonii.AAC.1
MPGRSTPLLPLALRHPGWSHTCDGIVKFVCTRHVPWFPEWSGVAGLLVDFLRGQSYIEVLEGTLVEKGMR